jgi:hypothetical protein
MSTSTASTTSSSGGGAGGGGGSGGMGTGGTGGITGCNPGNVVDTSPPTGTSYYVSVTDNASSNDGKSTFKPWTLAQLNTSLGSIKPGDAVLFKRGDTFGNVAIALTVSGSAGAPITIDAYGTGNNPVLDGGGLSASPILHLNGVSHVAVYNLVLQNSAYGEGALLVSGSSSIVVHNNFFTTAIRGISCMSSTDDLDFSYNYFTAIADTLNPSNGGLSNGGGNAVQLNQCNGSGIVIGYNKLYTVVGAGTNPTPGVGDQISLFKSNGTAASPIKVYCNEIRGGSSNPLGYCGIGLGDNGGAYQDVEYNVIVNSGIAGIQVAGGDDVTVSHNVIYGSQTAYKTYDGLAYGIWTAGLTSTNVTISYNSVNWTTNGGGKLDYYLDSNVTTPIGWSTNIKDSPSVTDAILPSPLWSGTPWNLNP